MVWVLHGFSCGFYLGAVTQFVPLGSAGVSIALAILGLIMIGVMMGFGVRFIPNDRIGIVEKLWSLKGSVNEGRIMAFNGEAGYEAKILRGGIHFFKWHWQYRVHRATLVTVPQGKVAYVYARDGEPLQPGQTLGRVVECGNFQNADAFLNPAPSADGSAPRGQRGRQRALLREGVYAINLAVFVVITEDIVYHHHLAEKAELEKLLTWQNELKTVSGFDPVIIGEEMSSPDPLSPERNMVVDSIGIVTIHDGPSLAPGEIIAPSVGNSPDDASYHNNYQDPEAFLAAGGRRGRQYVPITDGTYYLNRWFASIEIVPKTVVPIGYVGVVVSYYGPIGKDISGDSFRHGERVNRGERGVWERPMGPGKYPFNTYAGQLVLVPTTNFVLHWITGKTEAHRYDDTLKSIDLVTKDAYEPNLPLSVVVHIDYMKAPNVIQRFGDVKKLITQTLDPMLSAYFRDVAHKKTMLELLQHRDDIQLESRAELQRRFKEFDIECVDVLIGKPDTAETGGKIETLLEQLRMRELSIEQLETFERQRAAAEEQRKLNEAQAKAAKQAELTHSQVQIQIAQNQGDADLARARKQAEQTVVVAEAELEKSKRFAEQTVVAAEANSRERELSGRGESLRQAQIGEAEANVLAKKVAAFADPHLFAATMVAEHLSRSTQPLVPNQIFTNGAATHAPGATGMFSLLTTLLAAEKSGFALNRDNGNGSHAASTERSTPLS